MTNTTITLARSMLLAATATIVVGAAAQTALTPSKGDATADMDKHFGFFSGIAISIPPKYQQSIVFDRKEGRHSEIRKINIYVRKNSLSPIATRDDLIDWMTYWKTPPDRLTPEHQWLAAGIIELNDFRFNGSLENLTEIDKRALREKSTKFQCNNDETLNLHHCQSGVVGPIMELTDIFFNNKHGTLIECNRASNTKVIQCIHYFLIPKIKGVGNTIYQSKSELANFMENEHSIREIVEILTK